MDFWRFEQTTKSGRQYKERNDDEEQSVDKAGEDLNSVEPKTRERRNGQCNVQMHDINMVGANLVLTIWQIIAEYQILFMNASLFVDKTLSDAYYRECITAIV